MQYMKHARYFFIALVCLSQHEMPAIVVGSDTGVQPAKDFFIFPEGQTNNRLANYGWAPNGFALENGATTALFDSVFPVAGPINLNSGTLVLNRDFLCNNITTLQGLGTITGQHHIMTLSSNTTALPINTVRFQDTKIILNNDVTISSSIKFTGICYVEGNGYELILGAHSGIKVDNDSTLVLHNVILRGVHGTNVQCLNDAALLILDNARWCQTADSTFLLGALQFRNQVIFSGPSIFAYQTLKTSLISSQATLMLDTGFTFSYDPVRLASKTLLQFSDATSALFLNGATLSATSTGLNLTRGSLIVRGDSVFITETKDLGNTTLDQGITLGDGLSSVSDFATTILSGARLQIAQGSLNYRNLLSSSWFMENSVSNLNMGDATTLRLYETLNLGLGTALCNANVTIARVPQAKLLGSVSAVANLFFAQL